ncbi:MAG: UDP-N-acetylmuramate--alanine ligase [Alphaproteobacteria bacterium]|nr:UDP-N-acetylmuramate--alanine ligase [Alphaproteobacteria bacterium]
MLLNKEKTYFFCGIGGSGMLPLAMIMQGQGYKIAGSDRGRDQGRTPEKFAFLETQGMALHQQDGSGITADTVLVVSTAVENTIPDVQQAKALGCTSIKRAELLAQLFNDADSRIAIAGTSGKSTTTGMVGYALHTLGKNPTVMNGAVFKNFQTTENPYSTALSGDDKLFIIEADESDGSIELYNPTIAVLNNITLDHKSLDELDVLFTRFLNGASAAVLNLDDPAVAKLAGKANNAITYGIHNKSADIVASNINGEPFSIQADITFKGGETHRLSLHVPGQHNLQNALAALSTLITMGVPAADACQALSGFTGVKRRMDVVGEKSGVTVIDDFGHNPDKISATLKTLKEFKGRLLVVFQMHGFGPLKLMYNDLMDSFTQHMEADDVLYMPEVLYLGGTADQSVNAKGFIGDIQKKGLKAHWFEKRDAIEAAITAEAKSGDRIVIMGARDDTLSDFAKNILLKL